MKKRVCQFLFATALVVMSQQSEAQKLKNFQEGMLTKREFGRGYTLAKKYNNDKARKAADEYGFKIVGWTFDNHALFVPDSEYKAYQRECAAILYAKEYKEYGGKKDVKAQDFMSVGTAYIYESFDHHSWQYDYHWRKFLKCNDVKWTGELKDGLLEGQGCGYIKTKSNLQIIYVFEGTFHNGFMTKGHYALTYVVGGGPRQSMSYDVDMKPFSGGVAWMKDNSMWDYSKRLERYSLVDTEGNILIDRKYENVKQDFKDGKAIVTDRGMDIVIDKSGRFLAIAEGVTEIPKAYFANGQFADMKSITIPRSVTKIGQGAFEGCKSLTAITIPSSTTSIGSNAFKGCTALATASVPEAIAERAKGNTIFASCNSLKAVTVCNTDGTTKQSSDWYWYLASDPDAPKPKYVSTDPESDDIAEYKLGKVEIDPGKDNSYYKGYKRRRVDFPSVGISGWVYYMPKEKWYKVLKIEKDYSDSYWSTVGYDTEFNAIAAFYYAETYSTDFLVVRKKGKKESDIQWK